MFRPGADKMNSQQVSISNMMMVSQNTFKPETKPLPSFRSTSLSFVPHNHNTSIQVLPSSHNMLLQPSRHSAFQAYHSARDI
jgi:hypothetical protein